MSAAISLAVRRLPRASRLVSPRSPPFVSRQPICLATYALQCSVRPRFRGYASQSNNNNNTGKKDESETKENEEGKKVEENKDDNLSGQNPPSGEKNNSSRLSSMGLPNEVEKDTQLRNENAKKDDAVANENKEGEKNVDTTDKDGEFDDGKPPGIENSGFRNFFSQSRHHGLRNWRVLPPPQNPRKEEGKSEEKKKDSIEDRVNRLMQEAEERHRRILKEKAEREGRDPKESSSASSDNKEDGKKEKDFPPDPTPPPHPPQPPKSPLDGIFTFHNLFLSISAAYILYKVLDNSGDTREITWQEFRTAFLDKGLVDKLTVVNDKVVKVTLHSNATGQMYPEGVPQRVTRGTRYYFSIGSVEAFERRLDEAQKELGIPSKDRIPVAYSQEVSYAGILTSLLPLIIVIATLTWLSRRVSGSIGGRPGGRGGGPGGIFDFSSSKAKMFNVDQKINVTFKDVAGLDEAKEEIVEFVKFLKEPQVYERLGAKIPRGAILSGPPGTGKTLLAKATAGEAGVPFLSVSGSEFVEMFVGVGAARVRDLFAQARKHQPSIIFIDEIDAIGKSRDRGKFRVGNDEREQTLNQILVEMDGFGTTEYVVVLAGTNRVDTLDPALMRPGRFDRHIAIDGPDLSGRKQIFKVHLKKLVLADPVEDLADRLSVLTAGFTGAGMSPLASSLSCGGFKLMG